MARLLLLLLIACMLPVEAHGTLIIVAPTANGVVIAADSRTVLGGIRCDDQSKITALKTPKRTVVAVTGSIAFIKPPGPRVTDVCRYVGSAPRMLDVSSIVTTYLERRARSFSDLPLDGLAAECVRAARQFESSNPGAFDSSPAGEIFSVVLVNYEPKSKTTSIVNFIVRIDLATHDIRADRWTHIAITPQTRRGIWSYGETDYLNSYVLGGIGRKYLSKPAKDFILVDEPVAATTRAEAVTAAVDIIQAASQTASTAPPPSGIGGPINVLFLGDKSKPERVRWKGTAGNATAPQDPLR